jgi:iron-sulfur cluster repair protein YtfE (RIC family)
MARHVSLIPLSHDHHHGLVVALRLKKGGPASQNDSWLAGDDTQASQLLEFADSELLNHFMLEEELIFPILLSIGNHEITNLTKELIEEHRVMRASLDKIRQSSDQSMLKHFGELLESHIRKEERILFPLIEREIEKGSIILPAETIKSRRDSYTPPLVC